MFPLSPRDTLLIVFGSRALPCLRKMIEQNAERKNLDKKTLNRFLKGLPIRHSTIEKWNLEPMIYLLDNFQVEDCWQGFPYAHLFYRFMSMTNRSETIPGAERLSDIFDLCTDSFPRFISSTIWLENWFQIGCSWENPLILDLDNTPLQSLPLEEYRCILGKISHDDKDTAISFLTAHHCYMLQCAALELDLKRDLSPVSLLSPVELLPRLYNGREQLPIRRFFDYLHSKIGTSTYLDLAGECDVDADYLDVWANDKTTSKGSWSYLRKMLTGLDYGRGDTSNFFVLEVYWAYALARFLQEISVTFSPVFRQLFGEDRLDDMFRGRLYACIKNECSFLPLHSFMAEVK